MHRKIEFAFEQQTVYVECMSRMIFLSIAILVWLLPALVVATPVHKRPLQRWHGYGFLPGYHQPPNERVPVYGSRRSISGTPDYTPQYWYNGDWYYYGRPGFYRGRYNGGSFGPCWTQTPIGPIWNCG
jgi:hypothetical protein